MENKTLRVDRNVYESKGEVFEVKTEQELVSVYIHDDGWLHFKASFHKKFIDELIKKLEDIK